MFLNELKKANVQVDHMHDASCVNNFLNTPLVRDDPGFWSWLKNAVLN